MNRLPFACMTAFAVLSHSGWAQVSEHRIPGEVTHLKMDYATGEITTLDPAADALVPSCFDNSALSGTFTTIGTIGDEFIDWGHKSCGLTGLVCEFSFGYSTTALDPGMGGPGASIDVSFYPDYRGLCSALGAPAATYSFSGLPGSPNGIATASFTMKVDISTAGFALADGPFGWGYTATDAVSGPLLVTTTGTCAGAPDPVTGTEDCFDRYSGGLCQGTMSFVTPGTASFYMQIGEDDGAFGIGSQAQRFGTGCNVGVLSLGSRTPTIGIPWDPSITKDALAAPVVDFFGISSGPGGDGCVVLIDDTFPNPFLTDGGGVGFGSPFSIPILPDCSLIGFPASIQAGQLGAGVGFTNAIDFTIGITALPVFKDMVWSSELVQLDSGGSFFHTAILDGTITVTSLGAPNGSVLVVFDDASSATVTQLPSGATVITTGTSLLNLLTPGTGLGDIDDADLGLNPISLVALAAQLRADVVNNVPPAAMSDSSRAALAFAAVSATTQWGDNVVASQLQGALGLSGVNACKAASAGVTFLIVVSATEACQVESPPFTSICVDGTDFEFGWLTLPCEAVCNASGFVGEGAVKNFILANEWFP